MARTFRTCSDVLAITLIRSCAALNQPKFQSNSRSNSSLRPPKLLAWMYRSFSYSAPTRLSNFVNLKTAKALGLDVPPSVLARAGYVATKTSKQHSDALTKSRGKYRSDDICLRSRDSS